MLSSVGNTLLRIVTMTCADNDDADIIFMSVVPGVSVECYCHNLRNVVIKLLCLPYCLCVSLE